MLKTDDHPLGPSYRTIGFRRADLLLAFGLYGAAVIGILPNTRSLGTVALLLTSVVAGFRMSTAPAAGGFVLAVATLVNSVAPPYFLSSVSPARALFVGFVLGYFFQLTGKRQRLVLRAEHGLALLLMMTAVASMLWAPDQGRAITLLLSLCAPVLLFMMMISKRGALIALDAYARGVLVAGTVSVLLGLLLVRSGGETVGRFTGVYSDPNFYALYLCTFLPFALIWPGISWWFRLLTACVMSIGVFLTVSRTGMVLLVIMTAVLTVPWLVRRNTSGPLRRVFWLLLAVGTLTILFFVRSQALVGLGLDRVANTWTVHMSGDDLNGLNGRIQEWKAAFEVASHTSGVGGGLGAVYGSTGIFTHNTWLELLAELGVVGLASFAGIVIHTLRHTVRTVRRGYWGALPFMVSGLLVLAASFSLSMEYMDLLWASFAAMIWVGDVSQGCDL